MAKFMGVVFGGRGEATRLGHQFIETTAASWHGAITVKLKENEAGEIVYTITERPWRGVGQHREVATGIVGWEK